MYILCNGQIQAKPNQIFFLFAVALQLDPVQNTMYSL